MTPTDRVVTFRPDEDLLHAMETLRDRDGVPFSQQIRRALRQWLEEKGVLESERKRAVRKSESISAQHAADINVVDLIAPSVPVLLDTIDGRQVVCSRRFHTRSWSQ